MNNKEVDMKNESMIDSFQSYQISTMGLQIAIWAAKDGIDIYDLNVEKVLKIIDKYDYQEEFSEILGEDVSFDSVAKSICNIIIEEIDSHFDGWANLYYDAPPLKDLPREEMIAYLNEQSTERARDYWHEYHAAYTDPDELGADGMPKNGCFLTLAMGGLMAFTSMVTAIKSIFEFS